MLGRILASNASTGIACVILAMLNLSLQDGLVKWLGATYALHQIVLIRSTIAIGLIVVALAVTARLGDLRTRRWPLHLTRGLLLVVANSAFFLALAAMPLAEVVAIFFVAPLFITVLSVIVLREQVGPRRAFAVLLGFAGVVVMARPGTGVFGYVAFLPVVAAAAYAVLQILTRRLGTTDGAPSMAFYVHAAFIVVGAIMGLAVGDGRFAGSDDPSLAFLFRAWRIPDSADLPLFALVGLLLCVASLLLTQGYRITEAATVAPFEYVALPLSVFWGYLLWGEVPDSIAVVGMVMIAASGIFVILRTSRLETAGRAGTAPRHQPPDAPSVAPTRAKGDRGA